MMCLLAARIQIRFIRRKVYGQITSAGGDWMDPGPAKHCNLMIIRLITFGLCQSLAETILKYFIILFMSSHEFNEGKTECPHSFAVFAC